MIPDKKAKLLSKYMTVTSLTRGQTVEGIHEVISLTRGKTVVGVHEVTFLKSGSPLREFMR